ncbi:Meiotically up-regulated gene 113 [uncultured Caudovirales phage]|uniref:Meiotically up-regulated gene 113 n=1 Tax=uncultured Caudovirales phage TaxID=2100421 RepID=A0A6J5SKA7_9CAUD|nr:Meiotically up-regulated gene 113 [uncultured Caudovirales phage]
MCINTEYLYLIYSPLQKLHKIGVTNNPKNRLSNLSCASGVRLNYKVILELEPYRDEQAKGIEYFLHCFYKSKREVGEWFNLCDNDINDIFMLLEEIGGGGIYYDTSEVCMPLIDFYQNYAEKLKL